MFAIIGLACCTFVVLKFVIPAASVVPTLGTVSPRADAVEELEQLGGQLNHASSSTSGIRSPTSVDLLTIWAKLSSDVLSPLLSNSTNHSPNETIGRTSSPSGCAFCVMMACRTNAMISAQARLWIDDAERGQAVGLCWQTPPPEWQK